MVSLLKSVPRREYTARTVFLTRANDAPLLATSMLLPSSRPRSTTLVSSPSVSLHKQRYLCQIFIRSSSPGYTQALRPGVKVAFGLALDTQKLNEVSATGGPSHKVRPHILEFTTALLISYLDVLQVGATFYFDS